VFRKLHDFDFPRRRKLVHPPDVTIHVGFALRGDLPLAAGAYATVKHPDARMIQRRGGPHPDIRYITGAVKSSSAPTLGQRCDGRTGITLLW
jgi:hypothetical protein